MAAELVWRPVAAGDLEFIEANLRSGDRAEVLAADGEDVLGSLRHGVAASSEVMVWVWEGAPAAVVGVVDMGDGVGCPWLLGTDALTAARRPFMRSSRRYVSQLRTRFRRLANLVWMPAVASHRYLQALGFTVCADEPIAAGQQGERFALFWMEGLVNV